VTVRTVGDRWLTREAAGTVGTRTRSHLPVPTPHRPGPAPMKISRFTTVAIVAALLAVPVAAHASSSSPLLSGYGAPGSGDQTVLGSKLLPPKPATKKGAAPAPTSGPASLRAPAAAAAPVPVAGTPTPVTHHKAAPVHHTTPATKSTPQAVVGPSAPATLHAPPIALPVSAPGDSTSTGLLPFSTSDLWLGLLTMLLLGGVAVTTSRLGRSASAA
jgi:hypothetical protein